MGLRVAQTSPWRALVAVTSWYFLAGMAQAGAIAAWNPTPYAPQIVLQDDATGKIFHSICNNKGATIFPNDNSTVLAIDEKLPPRRNSRLAGVGWWADEGEWAAIQYQTNNNAIVHSLWMCDKYGHFQSKGSWIVSSGAPSVKQNTSLASVVLGKDAGYRIYYQDDSNSTCELSYSGLQGLWKYDGVISHDAAQGPAMSAVWTTPEDIRIVRPRAGQDIEVAKLRNNVTWDITTFPTPLNNVTVLSNNSSTQGVPTDNTTSTSFSLNTTSAADWALEAWDADRTSISLTVDSQNKSSVFYIGSDSRLHQVEEVGGQWQMAPAQNSAVWPPADRQNSEFGATYSIKTGEAWLFYISNHTMVSAYRSDDSEWRNAQVVDKVNTTLSDLGTQDGGLTTQAKIGVGVGVALSVTALAGLVVFVVMLKRRQAKDEEKKWQEASWSSTSADGSSRSTTSPRNDGIPGSSSEMHWAAEAHSQPIHELENQVWSHELANTQRHELDLPLRSSGH